MFFFTNKENVNLIESSPNQIFSAAISLMPFLHHNDANRIMTAANMSKQAYPLIYPEVPKVLSGFENNLLNNKIIIILIKLLMHVIA